MKRTPVIIFILVIVCFGFLLLKNNKKPVKDITLANYRNSNIDITFTYPKILSASTTANIVRLHHEIPFMHQNYCDFTGEGDVTMSTLTDFDVTFHTTELNLVDTMKKESPYIPEENFVNGEVIPSPGFIDPVTIGNMKGFSIFEGAEGCGHVIYYVSVSDKKTLVITNRLITIFTGAINEDEMQKALAVPGVLNKETAGQMFNSIVKTITVN